MSRYRNDVTSQRVYEKKKDEKEEKFLIVRCHLKVDIYFHPLSRNLTPSSPWLHSEYRFVVLSPKKITLQNGVTTRDEIFLFQLFSVSTFITRYFSLEHDLKCW